MWLKGVTQLYREGNSCTLRLRKDHIGTCSTGRDIVVHEGYSRPLCYKEGHSGPLRFRKTVVHMVH